MKQHAFGVLAGIVLLFAFFVDDGDVDRKALLTFAIIAAVMSLVGLLTAVVRAL